jgi:hypothetical protein
MRYLLGFKYNTGIQKSLSLKHLNPKGVFVHLILEAGQGYRLAIGNWELLIREKNK